MYHIFLDLEMMEIERKNKSKIKGLGNEIIEFGAIILDDNFKEVDSYKSYVRPEFSSRMRTRFVELTGVHTKQILTANKFETVLEDFCSWCLKYGIHNIRLYQWSSSDLHQLNTEYEKKKLKNDKFLLLKSLNWVDVQKLYGKAVNAKHATKLEKAIWSFGEMFKGRAHDAVNDARNTGMIYSMLQNEKDVNTARQIYNNSYSRKCWTCTLGEMLDFSNLQLVS